MASSARRRLVIGAAALTCAPFIAPRTAHAGAQQYEPLADAVQLALASQISDTRAPQRSFPNVDERMAFVAWLTEMSERLHTRIPDYNARVDFLKTLDYEVTRAGLDRQLVLGLIQVESNFRKYAVSVAGARGYMQVMPFWTRLIGDGQSRRLFEMRSNLRYGVVILRHYLDIENGNLYMALGRYNGSRGRPQYPNAVLAAWHGRWEYKVDEKSRPEVARPSVVPRV